MERRQFLLALVRALKIAAVAGPFVLRGKLSLAGFTRAVLPPGTEMDRLINRDPETLDARRLEPTPLEKFGTMGLTDHETDLSTWRLQVVGAVANELRLPLDEVIGLPAVERKVLMICPGVFAHVGVWKGVSMAALLERAGADPKATRAVIRGPAGSDEKAKHFPVEDLRDEAVFLAYAVNGKPLPVRHGFPLRTVADGYNGFDWIKYVYRVEVRTD